MGYDGVCNSWTCHLMYKPPGNMSVKYSKTGVYRGIPFFLFLLQNIDCGYSLEPPRRGGSNVYPQSMFLAKLRKISNFSAENFQFLKLKKSLYIAWASFRNDVSAYLYHNVAAVPHKRELFPVKCFVVGVTCNLASG